jgi:hypothetical protein
MPELSQCSSCLRGCQATVPPELEGQHLCVLHFILSIERACAGMRRETALGKVGPARQTEIEDYVRATAMELSRVATGSVRLPDELRRRVLTTFLTLMNLQESLDRSVNRFVPELRSSAVALG